MSEDRGELPSKIPGLSNNQRQEVREFSKKYYPSDRQNTRTAVTGELKGIRQERDAVRVSEAQQAKRRDTLEEKQQQMLANQEELVQRLREAEQTLRDREVSLASKIVDFLTGGRTKARFQDAVTNLSEQLTANQAETDTIPPQLRALDEELRRTLSQKLALRSDREVLERFYRAWGRQLDKKKDLDALAEYIPQHGTLSNVVDQYNCYVMHALQPNLKVNANNRVLNSHVPLEDRIAMLADIQPAISTSAFVEGNQIRNSWAGIGVFCAGDGYIESAAIGDRGTKASGIKDRSGKLENIDEYNRNLSLAILSPLTNGVNINELIVSGDYSISGLYINLDDRRLSGNAFYTGDNDIMVTRDGKKQMTNHITFGDIASIASGLEMPLFVYQQGRAYDATFDSDTGEVVKGKEVPPKEMVRRKYIVPPEKRQQLRDATRRSLRWPGMVATLV